jgi:ankyrin repeat protein
MAAEDGHEMVVGLLLENGADAKADDNGGWTVDSAALGGPEWIQGGGVVSGV